MVPTRPVRKSLPEFTRSLRMPVDLNNRLIVAKAEWEARTQQSISMNSLICALISGGIEAMKKNSGLIDQSNVSDG